MISRKVIVKIQRSIVTNADAPTMLVYNQDRSIQVYDYLTADVAKFMGDDVKCFAEADFVNGRLMLNRRVCDECW